MKQLLLLTSLFVSGFAFGQKDSLLPRNQLKLSPFRILDLGNPGIEMSYERLHGYRSSTQLSAAYLTDPVGVTPFENEHGFRLALEEKYFFKVNHKTRTYLSAEATYYHLRFDKEWDGLKRDDQDSSFVNFSYFLPYKRNTAIVSVKGGFQHYVGRHFLVDVALGLGFRYYKVIQLSQDTFAGGQPVGKNALDDMYDELSSPGSHSGFIVPFNIKLGYSF